MLIRLQRKVRMYVFQSTRKSANISSSLLEKVQTCTTLLETVRTYAHHVIRESVNKFSSLHQKMCSSDAVDLLVTNRVLSVPGCPIHDRFHAQNGGSILVPSGRSDVGAIPALFSKLRLVTTGACVCSIELCEELPRECTRHRFHIDLVGVFGCGCCCGLVGSPEQQSLVQPYQLWLVRRKGSYLSQSVWLGFHDSHQVSRFLAQHVLSVFVMKMLSVLSLKEKLRQL